MSEPPIVTAYLETAEIHERADAEFAIKIAYEQWGKEIDRYWQRANYTWALQIIFFTSAALAFKDGEVINIIIFMIISMLGSSTCFAGILMAKGSKFWIENWEGHIEILETFTKASIYKISVIKSSPGFSTTHLNYRLMQVFLFTWIAIFVACVLKILDIQYKFLEGIAELHKFAVISPMILLGFLYWIYSGQKLRLPGREFSSETESWSDRPDIARPWWAERSKPPKVIIVRD